jgi:lactoylglutathione lyase
MAIQFLHTKLRVKQLDTAARFYAAVFGYEVRSRRPGPGDSEIAFLTLADQGAELQLAQVRGEAPFEVSVGGVHLAFRVDDLDLTLAQALAAGATLVSGPYALGSGSIVAFLRDLDGYDLELVQKPAGR